jgi:hypothetical protein
MHQAESANPKNTRNFYRVFDESGYNYFNAIFLSAGGLPKPGPASP